MQNPGYFEVLSVLCETFLARYVQDSVATLTLPQPLKAAYEAVRQMCSCILSLYTPIPGYGGSCIDDAVTVFKYGGQGALGSFKVLLNEVPEWRDALAEALKFGAATLQLTPRVQALTEVAIQNMDQHIVTPDLLECVEELPRLTASLRTGALNDLEGTLNSRVKLVAASLMQKTSGSELVPAEVTAVSRLISLLAASSSDWEGVSDLGVQFETWQASMAGNLSMKQLTEYLQGVLDADASSQGDETEIDFGLLTKTIDPGELRKVDAIPAVLQIMLSNFQNKAVQQCQLVSQLVS